MIKNYLKLVLAFLALLILGYLYFKYDPINTLLFPKCPLYATTGVYCPGCGSQRATHALLNFDIVGVFKSNVLFLPAMLLVGYHYMLKTINHFIGTAYSSFLDRSNAPSFILALIILYWIARNLPYTFFDVLRP